MKLFEPKLRNSKELCQCLLQISNFRLESTYSPYMLPDEDGDVA